MMTRLVASAMPRLQPFVCRIAMREASLRQQLSTLGRFYRFAFQHWKLLLVALAAIGLSALTSGGVVLLVKPLIEGLISAGKEGAGSDIADTSTDSEAREAEARASPSPPGQPGSDVKAVPQQVPFLQRLVDYFGAGPDQLKRVALVILLILAPLLGVLTFVEGNTTQRLLWRVMCDIRLALFQKVSSMPLSFFASVRTGELISRLTNDIHMTHNAVRLLFSDVLKDPGLLVVLFAAAVWTNWQITLAVMLALPLVLITLQYYGRRIQRHGRKTLEKLADVTESISQLFAGIRVVKAFGMEDEENTEFRRRNFEQLRRAFRLVRDKAMVAAVPRFIAMACFGAVLLVGHHLLAGGRIKVEELGLVLVAVFMMRGPVKRLAKVYGSMRANMAAMIRIFDVLDRTVQLQDAPGAVDLDGASQGIRFNHVWFTYEDERYVLEDIDLFVPSGTVCAVVGETGAGKSTMLDLIPRFYDPARGSVEIDGVPVSGVKRESLLRQIAIVGQHPFLFNRSIAENIRYGRREASDQQVSAAARAANIHQFVSGLPEGYDTTVGAQGGRLSGGQRQCVTIARALLKDAPILILDEATSSLDSESELMVQQALANLMKGRTTFVIAHRLSTVRYANMIVVLKAGRIVEQGTHQELIARGGEYAKLHRIQFSGRDPAQGTGYGGAGVRPATESTEQRRDDT